MSSDESFEDLDTGDSGPTFEQALHKLLSPKLVKFHTEVRDPHSMSMFDTLSKFGRDEFGDGLGSAMDEYRGWLRDNFVPYKRKRASEVVDAVKASADAARSTSADKLLGALSK